jgi:indole-3-glycerol phosphate synthase
VNVDHLARIVATTREELGRRRRDLPQTELEQAGRARLDAGDLRGFAQGLGAPGLSLIAEHKRRSPSAGAIRDGVTVEEVVRAYQRGGAAALSVLTDGPSFGGSLADLEAARRASSLPILRKDFIVDSYQLHEALAAGADAILLIVAALSDDELRELRELAVALGLDALVEAHDERELQRALAAGAQLVGINNRDLTTLKIDVRRTFELRELVPAEVTVVAESGFSTPHQLQELEAAGVDAVLIGEALMRSPDIEAAVRELTGAGSTSSWGRQAHP